MQDYKLKPCPFCGGRKIELVEPEYFFSSWFCECTACRQAIAAGKTLETAMKKWNLRAPGWFSVDNEGYAIVTDLETDGSKILLEFSGIGGGGKQNEKGYGSLWRCKPTKNERENTPWEDEGR